MTNRPMFGLVAVAALVVVGCTGSGDDVGSPLLGPEGDTTVAATAGVPGTVTEEGAVIRLADGMIVDVPPQALPVGSEVTVTEIAPLDVPADITPLGPAYRIEAAAVPAEPVALQIPVPDGEDPEGIAIVHLHDGEVDLVGGQVVNGVFHTAVSSFSEVQLVKARIDEITSIAGLPPVDLDLEGADSETGPLAVEHGQLVTGERSEPAPRVISIRGPTEIAVGQRAVFTATGFASEHPEFVEYEWRVLGRNDAGVPGEGLLQRQLFLSVGRTGRYTVMVDARDPVTGAEAFAALTVFADDEAFTVFANPPLAIEDEPFVEVNVVNSVGNVDLIWGFSNGAGGRNTINTPGEAVEPGSVAVYGPVYFGPGVETLEEDLVFDVLATDADGAYSYVSIVLPATDDGRPRGAIVGPTSVEVGDAVVFTALTENVEGLSLVWDTDPGVNTDLAGDDDGEGPIYIDLDIVGLAVTGDPLPLVVSHGVPPDALVVGETGTWTARIRGGVVAAAPFGFRRYELVVDFGDGTTQELWIPAVSALDGVLQEVTHSFESPGTYEVTLSATSFDGQTDSATATVVVSDQITVEAADPLPWTFRGAGTEVVQASTDFGSGGFAERESAFEVEIVLRADGSATGTFTFHLGVTFYCAGDRIGDVVLTDRDQEIPWEGIHDAGSFTLLPGTDSEVSGTYTADSISGVQFTSSTRLADDDCDGTRNSQRDRVFEEVPRQR
jgi:hypothetical protein